MSSVTEIMDRIEFDAHGYFRFAEERGLIKSLDDIFISDRILTPVARIAFARGLQEARAVQGEPGLLNIFSELLADPENFQSKSLWAFYWMLAEAEHKVMGDYESQPHEPELNGSLVHEIRECTREFKFRQIDRDPGHTLVLATCHMVRGYNEKKTGGDFALVLVVKNEESVSHYPIIVQAKRAGNKIAEVLKEVAEPGRPTQLALMAASGIGYYVFYNEFGGIVPTSMRAESVAAKRRGTRIDTINSAHDFAMKIALIMPTDADAPERMVYDRDAAIDRIFNSKIKDIRHYPVAVAMVCDAGMDRDYLIAEKAAWTAAIEERRSALLDENDKKKTLEARADEEAPEDFDM